MSAVTPFRHKACNARWTLPGTTFATVFCPNCTIEVSPSGPPRHTATADAWAWLEGEEPGMHAVRRIRIAAALKEIDAEFLRWEGEERRERDPGCKRHSGDPHSLCPECWKAEA